jgi:hypothetical protein
MCQENSLVFDGFDEIEALMCFNFLMGVMVSAG